MKRRKRLKRILPVILAQSLVIAPLTASAQTAETAPSAETVQSAEAASCAEPGEAPAPLSTPHGFIHDMHGIREMRTRHISHLEKIPPAGNSLPGLFGGVEQDTSKAASEDNPALFELRASTEEFFQDLRKQTALLDTGKRRAKMSAEEMKFFGEPIIARLDNINDTRHDYYLVILHFNIPTLNPALSLHKYNFARFKAKFVTYRGDPGEGNEYFGNVYSRIVQDGLRDRIKSQHAEELGLVRVIAVSPMNESFNMTRTDSNTFSSQLKPSFFTASAGSLTDSLSRQNSYNFKIPTAAATSTRYGDATWTFYARKNQPLMLGSRTTLALIAVDKVPESLEDLNREYQARVDETNQAREELHKCEEAYEQALSPEDGGDFASERRKSLTAAQDRATEAELALKEIQVKVAQKEADIKAKLASVDFKDENQIAELTRMLCSRKLRIQGSFDYQLKTLSVPGVPKRLLDADVLDMNCMNIDDLVKIDSVDIPSELIATLKSSFTSAGHPQ